MKNIRHEIFDIASGFKGRSVYALIDGRTDETIAGFLQDNFPRNVCLITRVSDVLDYEQSSPWLVQISEIDEASLKAFMEFDLESYSGMFIVSESSLDQLAGHLAQFLLVKNDLNQEILFRFYDPRVFLSFMSCATSEHKYQVLGDNNLFVMEDEKKNKISFDSNESESDDLGNAATGEFRLSKEELGYMNQCYRERSHSLWIEKYKEQDIEASVDEQTNGLLLKDREGSVAKVYEDSNVVVAESPEGRVFQYRINSNKSIDQVTDPAGTWIDFDYDERDFLLALRQDDRKTLFEYGPRNNLKTITFPDSTEHKYTYTPLSRLHTSTDRNGSTTEYKYKGNGVLKEKIDPLGNRTIFETDDDNNPVALVFPDSSRYDIGYSSSGLIEKILVNDSPYADFDIDEDNNTINVNYHDGSFVYIKTDGDKKILEVENEFSKISFDYDDQGRLIAEHSKDATVNYQRDEVGSVKKISTTTGVDIDIKRDKDHRASVLTDSQGNSVKISYALNGALEGINYPNGVTTSFKTNKNGFPVSVKTGSKNARFYKAEHSYDLCDRLIKTITGSEEKAFIYDAESRLTQVKSSQEQNNEFFRLDANGNILEDRNSKNIVSAADKLEQTDQYLFSYDEHGRVLSDGINQFEYNGRGQVIRVIRAGNPADTIEYKYDALGRRIRKKLKDNYTVYIWAGETLISEQTIDNQYSTNILDKTEYLYVPGTHMPVSMIKDDKPYYFHTGQRNEVLFITDEKAHIAWKAEYSAFGQATIQVEEIQNPIRLTGQYFDPETGLHYNLARYYNPDLGRFYTRDPLFVDGGSGNFYTYCNGDPINKADPTGELVFCAAILAGALIGAAVGAGLEAYKQRKAIKAGEQEGYSLWGIAKAGVLGGILGAVGGGIGAAVGGVMAATSVVGFAGAGFVEGFASTFAEQCTENALTGSNVGFGETLKNALVAGTIGAALGAVTFGVGGVMGNRARKAATEIGETVATTGKKAGKTAAEISEAATTKTAKNIDDQAAKGVGYKKQKCNTCKGDPVNMITGEVVADEIDFTFPGRMEFAWTRNYGSHSTYQGHLGHKWQTPADMRIELNSDGTVHFFDGGPGYTVFESLPDANPVMEARDGAVLSRLMDIYKITLKSGIVYNFKIDDETKKTYYIDKIRDPHMNFVEFFRDRNCLKQVRDNSGAMLDISSESGRIKQIFYTGPDSEKSHLFVSYEYDEHGDLISVFDALGNPHTYNYKNHLLVKHTDRNGNSYFHEYDEYSDHGKCVHAYGDDNYLTCTLDYYEYRTVATDSLGAKTTIIYDDNHLPLEEVGHSGFSTLYTYDKVGRCTSLTDPMGRETYYEYDESGNNTSVIRPDGKEIKIEYTNNQPGKIIDANQNTWIQEWDNGLLNKQISPLGAETKYFYNSSGDLSFAIDAKGHDTRFETDNLGIVESLIDARGNTTVFTRDDLGNITRTRDAKGGVTAYTYDAKSRLVYVEKPSGGAVSCRYDAQDNLIYYRDENGHITEFEYTFTDKVAKRKNPDGTEVIYSYDTEDRLISVTNEKGLTYSFTRDHAGRVTHETDYYGNTTEFVYNPQGLLLKKIDPLNRITEFSFDTLGRLTHKRFYKEEDDQTPYKTESFEYDANGNLTANDNDQTQVTRIVDAENRVVTETQGDVYIYHEYDVLGQRIKRQTSLGNVVEYEYDELGNTSAITINNEKSVNIQRDEIGLPIRESFSGHLAREYQYNKDGLLTHQSIGTPSTQGVARAYTYDLKGNLVEINDSAKGRVCFSYDPMGRISRYIDPEQRIHNFLRDPAGDLIHQKEIDPESGVRTSAHGKHTYTYDAAGNLLEKEDRQTNEFTTFSWDDNNRLITANCNGTITDMVYDATGRRTSKETNGEKTQFYWDNDALLADSKNGQTREFIYYPGTFEPLAVIDKDKNVLYFNNDIAGLPREVVTDGGEVVWSASYDAHGKLTWLHEDHFDNPLRLQGQYWDEEIGLCYNRNRYYDPDTGSFVSADPLGLGAGTNNYAYAPNVWGWIDPLGLMTCPKTLAKEVPEKYKQLYKCKEFADSLKKKLEKNSIKGEVLDVKTITNKGMAGNIWSDAAGKNISTNGTHQAIKVGNDVFDNMNPGGIPYENWKTDLFSPVDLTISSTPF